MTDFIEVIDDALDPGFCDHMVGLMDASPHLRRGEFTGGYDPATKRSTDLYLDEHPEYATELVFLKRTTSRALLSYFERHVFLLLGAFHFDVEHPVTGERTKLTPENFTELGRPNLPQLMDRAFRLGALQAQKYEEGKGGFPAWHCETSPQDKASDPLHRVLLFMFYLNDVAKGGETEFYYQDRAIAPRKGRMVIAPAYFTHTHRGNVPLSGDKYIVTSWVLFRRSKEIYG